MEQVPVLGEGHVIPYESWNLPENNPTYADIVKHRLPPGCLPIIQNPETVVEKTQKTKINTYIKYDDWSWYSNEHYNQKGKLKNNHKKKRRQSSFRGERKHPESSIEYNTLHGYNGEFDYSHYFYMVRPHLVPCNYCNQYNGTCMGCSYYEEHYVEATIQYLKLHGSYSS